MNHGKPFYKREASSNAVTVLIYFWDDRDGPSFSGWWFGPKVGGDQVWALNRQKTSPEPPALGWCVPWDGPEDKGMRLAPGRPSHDPSGRHRPDDDDRRNRARQDEERRRGEDDRRRDDGRRREEEDRRRKVAAAEEERRRHEERRRQEEKKRQEEEERRREEEKRRREEERRRREEEQRREEKRRREQEIRAREEAAAATVRKVIQRVRNATPETIDQLRSEMKETLEGKVEQMGGFAFKVSEEAESTLKQAQQKVDAEVRRRAEEQRRREEEEKRKRLEAERVDKLLAEATQQVKDVEPKVAEGEEAITRIPSPDDAAPDEIAKAAKEVQAVVEACKAALQDALKWLQDKHRDFSANHPSRGKMSEWSEMTDRLETGVRTLDKLVGKAAVANERAVRKSRALDQESRRKAIFDAHDQDQDGVLSREEILEFGKAVHAFDLPTDVLDRILRTLEPVTYERFHSLHQKVGIAKMEAQARARRAEQEARRQRIESERQAVQNMVNEVGELLKGCEDRVKQAEADAKPVTRDSEETLSSDDLQEIGDKTEKVMTRSTEDAKVIIEKLKAIEADIKANQELRGLWKRDIPKLYDRQERVQIRVEKVSASVKKVLERAAKKASAELDVRLTEVVCEVHRHLAETGTAIEDKFAEVVGDADAMSCDAFVAFVQGLPQLKVGDKEASKLFGHVSLEGADIGKERFADVMRLFYKCVKGTVLNLALSIKSKSVRRLEVGELLEAVGGPSKEEGIGLMRVKVKALDDEATGWATIAGNQGTPFLHAHGNFLTVARERPAAVSAAQPKASAEEPAERKAEDSATTAQETSAGDGPEQRPDEDGNAPQEEAGDVPAEARTEDRVEAPTEEAE